MLVNIYSVLFHLIPQTVSWMQTHLHVDSFSEGKKGKLYPWATNESMYMMNLLLLQKISEFTGRC